MDWKRVARWQGGVVTLQQALRAGLTPGAVRARLQAGKWQRLHRGVYLTHSGPVGDDAVAWAVLLAAGEDALLSHGSALWVWGVGPPPTQWTVLVPHDRRRRVDGAVLVRTRDLPRARSVNGYRTTSLHRAVVDVADVPGAAVDDVIALAAKVCQKGFTTPERIIEELASRRGHRMRRPLRLILGDLTDGLESLAEHRFLHGVVRAHELPPFAMQVIMGQTRADFANKQFAVSAEIDGLAFHAGAFRSDRRRDRKSSARGVLTVRATWWDVEDDPCDLAQDLADTLRGRGWTGTPIPCSRTCGVRAIPRAAAGPESQ
ncbi:type IV toxin-antitoxin system AbiEi family antitoxin domain-containing protein [Ornithinimicrobium cryptoxanthini]|uniref:Type IV toxin-antitoxin system AbiEi family antitoxin domain-containing protein n=1 Tax=Ornithinimicrobium cryptoxanthini TaxID=2934161 RepID=A0ABY4YF09_9MICO|nr:type IV toxin-antitoxin system AbiEi family antitoxin domain-containing protein [Ornithinimicrobium cryptoxanthini]USQ75111.1 type IV toxin-antitoxin system AbiEi family antitoxin domain-containing protein [Ornithinimicrobium cryptoxanthini]